MLSYPDSKELERLGYPQELKEGDWYYWESTVYSAGVHELILCCDDCADTSEKNFGLRQENYVRVPTTDGMIEGLKPVASYKMDWNPIRNTWKVHAGMVEPVYGASLDQALCELWKKVKTVPSTE